MSEFGKLLYKFYYYPKNKRAVIEKFGGKQNYATMLAAEEEMKHYALNKLTLKSNFNNRGKYRVNFLTGDKYIHQSLFCTYSLFKYLSVEESNDFSVNFYSDGTLSDSAKNILKTRFPEINVVDSDDTAEAIKAYLPQSSFPQIHKKLADFPLIKKLIYPNINKKGLNIFLDSDMLFMQKPEALLNWLNTKNEHRSAAFCICDVVRSYGYTDEQILKVYSEPIKNNINSGMYALHSENVDFKFIENIIEQFEINYGPQYYMEQLITAIILERAEELFIAPAIDYIVLPTHNQIKNQTGTLHHYVNESKKYYFIESWRKQLV